MENNFYESISEHDIFGKGGNGTLDAVISREVEDYGKGWDESKSDCWLDVSIGYNDLLAIHSQTFLLTFGKEPETEFILWENVKMQITAKFPMLCKFRDIYEDAIFKSDELETLLAECIELKSSSSNKALDVALRKIVYCCKEAINTNLHLGFWCD